MRHPIHELRGRSGSLSNVSFLAASACVIVLLLGGSPALAIVTFNFIFEDLLLNTGAGFDDPNEGAERRATLIDVADNIVGKQLNNSAVVDIFVEESKDLSGPALASAGQTYSFISGGGFDDGVVAEHIQTGINPSPGSREGFMTWDFTHNWHYDIATPTGARRDFRSVVTHELTHAMGFASLIDSVGRGLQDTQPDTYSRYDSFLENEAGVSLITSGRFNGIGGAALTDLTSAVYFDGPNANAANNGTRVPLYTPDPFDDASLSHVGDNVDPMFTALPTARSRRWWSLVDRGILQDLGYQINDAVIPERTEILSDTTLGIVGSLFVGGDQDAAQQSGSLTVTETATVNVNGSAKIWNPGMITINGTLSVGTIITNEGALGGHGTLLGEVRNTTGTVQPGNSPGGFTIGQNFVQSSGGTLEIEIGGTVVGQHDVLNVGNMATLAGTLSISRLPGYSEPFTRGSVDEFTILTAASRAGNFDTVEYDASPLTATFDRDASGSFGTHLGHGRFRNLIYNNDSVLLQNVAALAGDTDGDVKVDIFDVTTVVGNFDPRGIMGPYDWTDGNFDNDDDIDIFDVTALVAGFSPSGYATSSNPPPSVPEPVGIVLLIQGTAVCLIVGRRRRHFPTTAANRRVSFQGDPVSTQRCKVAMESTKDGFNTDV